MIRVTAIVATLDRPELRRLLDSLSQQDMPRDEWQLITWVKTPKDVNEYDQRNKAMKHAKGDVIVLLDDDTYVDRDYVRKGTEHFEADPQLMVMGVRILVQGAPRLDMPGYDPGAALWFRERAWERVGGFETTWGLKPPVSGWRGDTDFEWRVQAAGMKYEHWDGITVHHPEHMKAVWDPRVERLFYERWKDKCLELFLPVDLRMPLYMMAFEKDLALRERAAIKIEEFTKAGYYRKEDVPRMIEEMKGLMGT